MTYNHNYLTDVILSKKLFTKSFLAGRGTESRKLSLRQGARAAFFKKRPRKNTASRKTRLSVHAGSRDGVAFGFWFSLYQPKGDEEGFIHLVHQIGGQMPHFFSQSSFIQGADLL